MRAVRLASEPATPSPYITATECAAYLRFASMDGFYRAVKTDGIPHRRCGRKLLFLPAELDRWMAGESRVTLMSEARRRHVSNLPTSSEQGESKSFAPQGGAR